VKESNDFVVAIQKRRFHYAVFTPTQRDATV